MKHIIIKNLIILLALAVFMNNQGMAQDDCKVLLDAIAGQYEGDCKKGLADGEGTAKGTDTYVGEFKKGLPHGNGTYTWENGDIYDGEFNKGLKDGKGKLLTKQTDGQFNEQNGFWKKDEYIGEYESPYDILFRSSNVLSIRIIEADNPADDGNAVFFEIQHKGRTQPAPDFRMNVINGNFQSRFIVGNTTKVLISNFPFGFTLSYMGESVEIQIYQARSWNIRIDFNK